MGMNIFGGGTNASGKVVEVLPNYYISRYLTDPDGSKDLGVNGSVNNVLFSYFPPNGMGFALSRMIIYLESGTNFDSTLFAHLPALANGVSIRLGPTEVENWKDNVDIFCTMYDVSGVGDAFSKTTKVIAGRWTLAKATGGWVPVVLGEGEGVEVAVRDDLSVAGLIFRIKVQGKLYDLTA